MSFPAWAWVQGLFAQQLKQTKPVEAVVFTKTIEQNFIRTDDKTKKEYNLAGKQHLEKLFFGDLNAQVEYLMIPPFAGAYGLRIVKTGQNASYKIEIKYIANYKEAESQIDEKFPLGSMSIEKALGMSEEEKHRMAEATRIKLIDGKKRASNSTRSKRLPFRFPPLLQKHYMQGSHRPYRFWTWKRKFRA